MDPGDTAPDTPPDASPITRVKPDLAPDPGESDEVVGSADITAPEEILAPRGVPEPGRVVAVNPVMSIAGVAPFNVSFFFPFPFSFFDMSPESRNSVAWGTALGYHR
jgi:hypothetical protein